MSLYVVWLRKDALKSYTPTPQLKWLILFPIFLLGWFLAEYLQLEEGKHLCLMGMLQVAILTFLGEKVFRALLFPILYLWLMVPSGAFLIYPLQWIAAVISGVLLDFMPILSYREGLDIQVPTGNYFIAPGCAGLNFVIASFALSIFYGQLMYQSVRKRLICVFAMVGMSILMNGIRIFLIIVIAHYTERKLGIVDDHLFYGWGFFSIVLLGMIWWGGKYQDPDDEEIKQPSCWFKEGKPSYMKAVIAGGLLLLTSAGTQQTAVQAGYSNPERPAVNLPVVIDQFKVTLGL